jgi:hypothetical protein
MQTASADLRTADNSVNYSRACISKPLALGIDPKIEANIWALEYIDEEESVKAAEECC